MLDGILMIYSEKNSKCSSFTKICDAVLTEFSLQPNTVWPTNLCWKKIVHVEEGINCANNKSTAKTCSA